MVLTVLPAETMLVLRVAHQASQGERTTAAVALPVRLHWETTRGELRVLPVVRGVPVPVRCLVPNHSSQG